MAIWNKDKNRYLSNNGKLFEVVMVAGQTGPSVYTSAGNLNASTDAFGRARVSEPYTLFDSSFRYADSERRWNTKISGGASTSFVPAEGVVDLVVGTASGDEVIRQTDRVFAYQPGKSLLVMNTFTMASPQTNLRQRVGYFSKQNGIYLEQDGSTIYIVKRSYSSGSIVEERIAQENWNTSKLNGGIDNGITLDLTKSQIFWMDIEWLGVGSVRTGFVMNGQFIVTHIFHHANNFTSTYMTTASLPCRYEITNIGTTTGATMKQICSTVLSEGGYEQIGLTRSATNPITGKNLRNNWNNPMVSIRLRSGRTDAVVIPRLANFYGLQATAFNYKLIRGGELDSNVSWVIPDSASSVEYDISATGIVGGTTILEGIFKGQTQANTLDLHDLYNNSLQLTRDIIDSDSAGDVITISITPTTNNDDAIASMTWQERTS